jgi:hypothetical protein
MRNLDKVFVDPIGGDSGLARERARQWGALMIYVYKVRRHVEIQL